MQTVLDPMGVRDVVAQERAKREKAREASAATVPVWVLGPDNILSEIGRILEAEIQEKTRLTRCKAALGQIHDLLNDTVQMRGSQALRTAYLFNEATTNVDPLDVSVIVSFATLINSCR